MKAFEYILSTTLPLNESALRTRITSGMPLVECAGKGSLLGAVARDYTNSNFIIHKASLVEGGAPGCMDSMIFCISFIGKLGRVIDGSATKEVWITGGLMNSLITHKIQKKKYVYDETMVCVGNGMGGGSACAGI